MKNLKFLIIFLSISFILYSCDSVQDTNIEDKTIELRSNLHFDRVIGKIINNEPVITADTNDLKLKWSAFLLSKASLSFDFNKIAIKKIDSFYYLQAVEFNSGSSAISLEIDNGNIYEAMVNGGTKTVTCHGCTSTGPKSAGECDVRYKYGYYCTSCSTNNCKKSTTVDADDFITGILGNRIIIETDN